MKVLELVSPSDRLRNFCLFCVLNRYIKTLGLDDWLRALLGIVGKLPALYPNPVTVVCVTFPSVVCYVNDPREVEVLTDHPNLQSTTQSSLSPATV